MRGRLLLALLPALALPVPAAALGAAGTVQATKVWESDGAIREDYTRRVAQLRYKGAPGAASNLTVRFRTDRRRVTITDPRGVSAGRNCGQHGPDRVRCRLRGPRPRFAAGAEFVLGNGDDVLRVRGRPFFQRKVRRRTRPDLQAATYTLRLEGTDATGAPVVVEERDLRTDG